MRRSREKQTTCDYAPLLLSRLWPFAPVPPSLAACQFPQTHQHVMNIHRTCANMLPRSNASYCIRGKNITSRASASCDRTFCCRAVPSCGSLALAAPLPPAATSLAPASSLPLSSSSLSLPPRLLALSSPMDTCACCANEHTCTHKQTHTHVRVNILRPSAAIILSCSPARALRFFIHAGTCVIARTNYRIHTCSSKAACSLLLLSASSLASVSLCFLAAAAAAEAASASLSLFSCSAFASRMFFSCVRVSGCTRVCVRE